MTRRFAIVLLMSSICLVAMKSGALAFNDRVDADRCSVAAGGDLTDNDIKVVCGIAPELFRQLVNQYDDATANLKERTEEQKELLALLRDRLKLNERQIAAALEAAGETGIPPDRIGEKLIEIAERYAELLAQLESSEDDDPEIAQLKQRAFYLIHNGELGKADEVLDAVIVLEDASLDNLALEAAKTRAQKAEVAMLRLRYLDAAKSYGAAAKRVPEGYLYARMYYLYEQADALFWYGFASGNRAALLEVIELSRTILDQVDKLEKESQTGVMAGTLRMLSSAQELLAIRDTDAVGLLELINLQRAAVESYAADSKPIDWADMQNRLGSSLMRFGDIKGDVNRLHEAVHLHRAVLQSLTPDQAPDTWASAKSGLGNALRALARVKYDKALLEEAVDAYRSALEVVTRAEFPDTWAMLQQNLGFALGTIGREERDTALLKEAVEAFRSTLARSIHHGRFCRLAGVA